MRSLTNHVSGHWAAPHLDPRATRVWFDDDTLWLDLVDGRTLGVPIVWLPAVDKAAPEERAAVTIEADGSALRWDALDEDVAVPHLLGLTY